VTALATACPVRIRLSPRAVMLAVCVLSILLFAVQMSNATACFAATDAETIPAQSNALGHGDPDAGDDCDAQQFFTSALPKVEDGKPGFSVMLSERSLIAQAQPGAPYHSTRGVPFPRDNTPLFLRTGRLRN